MTSRINKRRTDDCDGLNDSSDLEEALQVVDLSQGHRHQHGGLEHGPQNHTRVGALVDGTVNSIADLERKKNGQDKTEDCGPAAESSIINLSVICNVYQRDYKGAISAEWVWI